MASHLGFLAIDAKLRAVPCRDAAELWKALPEMSGQLPPEEGTDPVLLAFGDPLFVRRFAPALIASVARNSPSTHVHLHVFGTNGHGLPEILPDHDRVSVTWESCDHDAMGTPQRIRFYQSMRFVRLAQLLERSRRAFLAVDIDSLVQQDLNRYDHLWNGVDVGLIPRFELLDPGKRILAAAVFAAPTPAGRRFFQRVSARLLPHLLGAPYTEKLDQRCLYLTLHHDSTGVRVAPLPMSLAAISPEDAIILSFRGERKDNHPGLPETERSITAA
ncbi:hypothetical protein [Rhodoligotrophos defluvii]|uniref:hypothetical protein n=1 Tax=Rhodoligotrophos defluvii TaxID=2561934 RepID=UPI0010C95BE9|nr:hypothetical protein [Rhodoligotrophos defluvii]